MNTFLFYLFDERRRELVWQLGMELQYTYLTRPLGHFKLLIYVDNHGEAAHLEIS